jgi:hypothetical protein
MTDEIFDRSYQSGRHELHAGIDAALARLARAISTTFHAVHAVQFAAPWSKRRTNDVGCA